MALAALMLVGRISVAANKGKKNGKNRIIINVEIQRKEDPGYSILNRAIFYTCRAIASQKEREFSHSDYDEIKRTYSIWICMDSKDNCMSRFRLKEEKIIGDHIWKGDIGIINLVLIGINDLSLPDAEKHKFHRFLCALFAQPDIVPLEQKEEILENEYSVWNEDIRKEVEKMCNLSESISEKAEKRGEIKGTIKTLVGLVLDGLISIAEASKRANMSEDEFKKYLK